MYTYSIDDRQLLNERVQQFRGQMQRYLSGELPEDQFRPLRLQNGLYLQRQAPMLRIAVPYGLLNTLQLRKLAQITRDYDKGFAHVSTRQNFQLNWPALERVPEILAELAQVDMHCIQTSGNCIRNTTTDQFAGVAVDEVEDPRPYCELIRQWSTLHPEFAYLPRKFKIAVCGSESDRAAIFSHDVGLALQRKLRTTKRAILSRIRRLRGGKPTRKQGLGWRGEAASLAGAEGPVRSSGLQSISMGTNRSWQQLVLAGFGDASSARNGRGRRPSFATSSATAARLMPG